MANRKPKMINGVKVQDAHLTLEFCYAGHTIFLGRFDPKRYPRILDRVPTSALFGELYDQLEEFSKYPDTVLKRLSKMPKAEFFSYLTERETEAMAA
jgi:hypothetical protein